VITKYWEKQELPENQKDICCGEEEGTEGRWTKLHNEETDNQYSGINIMKKKSYTLGWADHVASIVRMTSMNKSLTGKTAGKRPIWRSRHKW
jgi:hypothetical protein